MYFNETGHKDSPCEWALLKTFSRSEVKGHGHDQIECYNGRGTHFDGVVLWLTCFSILDKFRTELTGVHRLICLHISYKNIVICVKRTVSVFLLLVLMNRVSSVSRSNRLNTRSNFTHTVNLTTQIIAFQHLLNF